MSEFNKKEFGDKLKAERLKNELSLENVGRMIGKNATTIGRYERGEIIPDAEVLSKLCDILNIYTGDLFYKESSNIVNIENSRNPFKADKLYLYYKGYVGKKKIGKFKLLIELNEKQDFIEVKISDYKSKKTILIGSLIADDNIATIRTENYKPNYPRLEANQIIINISEGTNGILLGTMLCTNGNYVPNMKKCLISKKDLTFTDEMITLLKCTTEERSNYLKNDIWLADIEPIHEFEYREE